MSNPITITVTAQTAQAAADLQKLAAQGSQSLAALGKTATEAGEHIAGMSYFFRSGIDTIRMAAMGGGDRAAFYAVDELTRALVAQGMSMTRLVPILGGLGLAIGAGVLVWHEWNEGTAEAIQHAKELAEAWKELPGLLKQINDLQQVGLLGPAAAGEYADYARGKKLYVDSRGQMTTQPTDTFRESVVTGGYAGMGGVESDTGRMVTEQNKAASYAQTQQWVEDQISAGGEVSEQRLKALEDLRSETQKLNEEGLQGIEKEKAAIHDRYASEQAEMEQNLQLATAKVGAGGYANNPEVRAAEAALASSKQREAAEIAAAEQKAANELLQQQLDLYQKYQDALGGVTTKFTEFSAKQAQTDKEHEEALRRQEELQQAIAQGLIESKLREIKDNPFLTEQQKQQQSAPLLQAQMAQNAQRVQQLADVQVNSPDPAAQLQAHQQIVELMSKQVELQQELNAAQGASSWAYQMKSLKTSLMNIPTLMQSTADILKGGIDTGVDSIASNFTKVIEGTEKFRQAILQIERAIATDLIQAIIKMGEQWVIAEILKLATSETVNTTAATTAGVTAALLAKLWEPAAVYSAIATDGVSLAAGVSAIAMGVFKEGGYTGDGDPNEVAGFVHRGEFVVPADVVRQHGLQNMSVDDFARPVGVDDRTAMALQGRAGAPGTGTPGRNVNNFHFYDERPHPADYLNSSAGQNHIIKIVNGNKRKVGIQT